LENKSKGVEAIRKALENMPTSAGIYRMLGDDSDKPLYIGKAKNLKNRVTSYTSLKQLSERIARMVVQVKKVEYVITSSEAEALLLESRLINEHRPPYNILLKDDKSFPYIAIDNSHKFPRIFKHRGKKRKDCLYFGPYPSVWAVDNTISTLQKIFQIRPCKDSYFNSRNRPCIEYEIKKCSAPCVDYIDNKNYSELISQTINFLNGKSDELKKDLQRKMQQASDKMEYEAAAGYRNRISALSAIQSQQSIYSNTMKDADIIGMSRASGKTCIQIFFLRGGKILGNSDYYPSHTDDMEDADIMEYFIMRFYEKRPTPSDVIISHDMYNKNIIEKILTENQDGRKIKITFPLKGEKRNLIEMALANAKTSLERKIAEEETSSEILGKVAKIFNIKDKIKRIEVFDNSHLFGTNAVGAMIVAGYDEEGRWGMLKKMYRRFNVDAGDKETGGDDFSMMRQVLKRRYGRIQKEESSGANFPELILIDGGSGQLSAATEIFNELGITDRVNYICIAKGEDRNSGREDFYIPGQKPFKLPVNDPVLYFLQNLRDEAHRFAITGYRKKHKKSNLTSKLDEIPDIGPTRKKALLSYFGSVRDIELASKKDLKKVTGISSKMAENIYDWLRS
jgi:excinuclease ABC subunit C